VTSDEIRGRGHDGFGAPLLNLSYYHTVSPGSLRAFGIPIVAGRDFQSGDAEEGAAIVGEDAARELWPGVDPVGRMIKLGGVDAPGEWVRVVGVARHASLYFVADPYLAPAHNVFVIPHTYADRDMRFVVRVDDNAAGIAVELGRALQNAVPGAGMPLVHPWLRRFQDMVDAREFMARLFAAFGIFALLLSSVGLYGVLSYAVNRRRREFGVRIALGAQRQHVLRLVLRESSVMILAGIGIGAFLGMWTAQFLEHWLYDVNPTDAVSLVSAELVLIAVSLGACALPGIRATRSNPVEVLRAS
jgi:hypothetical protein